MDMIASPSNQYSYYHTTPPTPYHPLTMVHGIDYPFPSRFPSISQNMFLKNLRMRMPVELEPCSSFFLFFSAWRRASLMS